jgi:hypothetical protein
LVRAKTKHEDCFCDQQLIPSKVCFTGLEFDPDDLADRWHRGIIPLDWSRHRFIVTEIPHPVSLLNRWLFNNIQGKWSIWVRYIKNNTREVNLAFEYDYDSVTFVLADGKTEAFRNAERF